MPNFPKTKFQAGRNLKKGFAALAMTLLVLGSLLSMAVSLSTSAISEQKIARNLSNSLQSHYWAESGLEDALLRLKQGMAWQSSYSFEDEKINVEISDSMAGSRTIASLSDNDDVVRKSKTVYKITSEDISFYYGVQVGEGGMEIGNIALVFGNVFSNGPVVGPGGLGFINDSVIVAGENNGIDGLIVGQDALVHNCHNSLIGDTFTYVSGGQVSDCLAAHTETQDDPIEQEEMPLSSSRIDDWKEEAAAGGIIETDYFVTSGTDYLGPKQIGTPASPKNLTVSGKTTILRLTGTVYVTGNIIVNNKATVELDGSYGSYSGILLADGRITVSNLTKTNGSGSGGSYLFVISDSSSLDEGSPALFVGNNATGAVFYTTKGLLNVNNNVSAREITGYKVKLGNGAIIFYESGLANLSFSSGTGGSWSVEEWEEAE